MEKLFTYAMCRKNKGLSLIFSIKISLLLLKLFKCILFNGVDIVQIKTKEEFASFFTNRC